jgi:tetratricopeptide (TPR) repeat protein
MMTELHYDDEKIIAFLHSEHIDAAVRRDPHLKGCSVCAGTLDEYRVIADTLGVEAVWDLRELKSEEPVPSTIASLRSFSDEMAREDLEAETYVAQLLEGPREWWSNKLRKNPHYRTAGVVRKLVEANDRAIDTMPPDAVEITALAVDIAEALDPTRYPSDTVLKLRGAAWRERGFALFYTGRYKEAPEAVDRAEDAFRRCAVADYELARIGILRAFTYRPLDRITEGVALARASAAEFAKFGDRGRVASARFAEVNLLLKLQDYRSALPQLLAIQREFDDVMTHDARARLTENIAYCYRELGMVEKALQAAQIAIEMFTALETPTELARSEWLVAGLLASQGKTADAQPRYQKVLRDFEKLGMSSAAALVRLDLCELLLLEQRFLDVEQMARIAMTTFEASGLAYTPRALTAISFLREAAQQKRATPTLAREVRRYIRELPEQPNLLFLPPPD